MPKKKNNYIIIGRFGRVYGVHGWIYIHPYTTVWDGMQQYEEWYLLNAQSVWVPIKRLGEDISHQRYIVKIEGFETRERAAQLTQKTIAVPAAQLPVLDSSDYYCFELIGMTVINREQKQLGIVTQVLETGANDVLVVEGDQRHLIPFLPEQVICSLSREQRQILVDWSGEFL